MSDPKGINVSAGFLVGRDKELATFLETFDAVIDGKGSRILSVSGEAGVGKTRLVGEFLELYDGPGVWVLKGRCLFQERETPYRPFIDILKEYRTKAKTGKVKVKVKPKVKDKPKDEAGIIPEAPVKRVPIDVLLDKAEALKDHGSTAEHEGALKEEREWMFSTITQTIKDMAKKDPVILFMDDVHWADMATVQLLDYLIQKMQDERVLFVVAYRSEDIWDSPAGDKVIEVLRRLKTDKHLTEIAVRPLDKKSTKEMAQFCLGIPNLPEDFAAKLHKETEGNPYFIEEVLKGLVWQGLIKVKDIASVRALDLKAISTPTSLGEAVLKRIEALGPDLVKVLQTASVIGDEFHMDILKDVLMQEKVEKDALIEAIDRLVMANIVSESPGGEEGTYLFRHNIIQAVIYQSISRGRQRLLHKEVGLSVEKRVKKMTPKVVYNLANHFAIGHVPDKAMQYNTMAGDKASSMYAHEEAIYFYTQALDFLELAADMKNANDRRMVLLLKIGDLNRFTGRWEKALEYYTQLETAAKETGDIGMTGMAVRKKGHVERYRGNWEPAENYLNEAMGIAKKDKDELAVADCERGLGYIHWRKGEYEQAISRLKESLKLSEKVNDYYITGRNYIELGNVYSDLGEFEKAEGHFKKAIELLEGINENMALARAYNNLGVLKCRTGEYKKSLQYLSESMEIYEKMGRPSFVWRTWCNISFGCSKLGRIKESHRAIERAEEVLKGANDIIASGTLQLEYGALYTASEEYDKAESAYVNALEVFGRIGIPTMEAIVHEELGKLYAVKGDKERAKDHLYVAEDIYKKIKAPANIKRITGFLKIADKGGPLPP
jgi:predicted ATPase